MATDWRIGILENETTDDSDKIFTVPYNTEWQVLWIWIEYTSTATSGSRRAEIQFQSSGSSVIAQWQAGAEQDISLTYKYLFGTGVSDLLAVRDSNYIMTPLMGASFLSEGQKIRIWDNKQIDATGDDMIVRMEYGYREL
jgi:hypothetical protein